MEHILDNPAWHALTGHNRHLGHRTGDIAYFEPAVSPFAAVKKSAPELLGMLHASLPFPDNIILVGIEKQDIAGPWKVLGRVDGYQMVYDGPPQQVEAGPETRPLQAGDVPQMLALTQLTNPGPFLSRTPEFGHYEGIFEGDRLVAMCGQRLHPPGFAEVSAVCTHPDYLGRGYARYLVLRQVNRILAGGEVPFLHVKAENERAIGVYEALGFIKRTPVFFDVLSGKS